MHLYSICGRLSFAALLSVHRLEGVDGTVGIEKVRVAGDVEVVLEAR